MEYHYQGKLWILKCYRFSRRRKKSMSCVDREELLTDDDAYSEYFRDDFNKEDRLTS
jgi:hypothetical protein